MSVPPEGSDTSAEAERVVIRLARSMSPARELAIAAALTRSVRRLAEAGVRSRHPGASEDEIRRRLAALLLPADFAREIYGAVGDEAQATSNLEVADDASPEATAGRGSVGRA
jgi:hypothetical protein